MICFTNVGLIYIEYPGNDVGDEYNYTLNMGIKGTMFYRVAAVVYFVVFPKILFF